MKSIDVTKENQEVREFRQKYLAAGKHYSHLLLSASKLNPHILAVTKEIQNIGNNISCLDSGTITNFYNSIIEKSKIDPAYHEISQELNKAKHILDHTRYQLFHRELRLALKKSGIPVKKHTLESRELAEIINDRNEKLLAKIAYATPYIKEELIQLSVLIEKGDVALSPGEISGQTRAGKSFLKGLSQLIVQRVNDQYFGKKELDIKRVYITSKVEAPNLLRLVRHIGDNEHLRELERRIGAGDIVLKDNTLLAHSAKGERYLSLLAEELNTFLEKSMNESMLAKNREAILGEDIFSNITQIISDYESKLARHKNITGKYDSRADYHDMVDSYGANILYLTKSKDEIFSDIERISAAALNIRKKLLILSNLGDINVGDTIPLISAYRLLANYENQLSQKIDKLSRKLDLGQASIGVALPNITDIKKSVSDRDKYYDLADESVEFIFPDRVKAREDLDNIVRGFAQELPEYAKYRETVAGINSLKSYLLDYLERENRLYRGNEVISTIVSQIVELEIERKELLSVISHEVQLAHKQAWLTSIRKENENYFVSNMGEDNLLNDKAVDLNARIISQIEGDIRELIGLLKGEHDKHSVDFLDTLKGLATRVQGGEDVSNVSADIRKKYMLMDTSHKEILQRLNREMSKLNRQLIDLPLKSRKAIEKNLIFDIKKQVEK